MAIPPDEEKNGDFLLHPPQQVSNALSGNVAGPVLQAGVIQNVTVNYHPDSTAPPVSTTPAPVALGARVPRTAEGIAETRQSRPNLWEYLLYAGELHVGRACLEAKRLDYDLGHRVSRQVIQNDADAVSHLSNAFEELRGVASTVARWMSPDAQLKAFGPPGTPGDPELITHIARRLVGTYESLLDWAISLRSVTPPPRMATLFELASRYSEDSLHGFDSFVDTLVRETDEASAVIARNDGSTANVTATYTMDISPQVIEEFEREQRRVTPKRFRPTWR